MRLNCIKQKSYEFVVSWLVDRFPPHSGRVFEMTMPDSICSYAGLVDRGRGFMISLVSLGSKSSKSPQAELVALPGCWELTSRSHRVNETLSGTSEYIMCRSALCWPRHVLPCKQRGYRFCCFCACPT